MPRKERRAASSAVTLAIAAVIQNEAPFLAEWLEYHMLPRLGVQQFALYDDGSTDSLGDAVAPFGGAVHVLTTDALKPWPNASVVPARFCLRNRLFKRLAAPQPPYEHFCTRTPTLFPQQIAMIEHAAQTVSAEFIAFIDADEFLVSTGVPTLPMWLRALPRPVGGVLMQGGVMLSTRHASPLLNETMQMKQAYYPPLQKCIVRRSAVRVQQVGFVHEIALEQPWHYVADPAAQLLHFRHRAFEQRLARRYMAEGTNDATKVGKDYKAGQLRAWQRQRRHVLRNSSYIHYVAHLTQLIRLEQALHHRGVVRMNRTRRRVVLVAEARSGSSWASQRVFGSRTDVLYLYEPCRVSALTPRYHEAECIAIIRELLDCALPLPQWRLLRSDIGAVKHSTPGAYRDYVAFMRMCRKRHIMIKTVRVADARPLATNDCLVVHIERNASEVRRSRAGLKSMRNNYDANIEAGQRLRRQGANVTVHLEAMRVDPEGVAMQIHSLSGMLPMKALHCDAPATNGFDACKKGPR